MDINNNCPFKGYLKMNTVHFQESSNIIIYDILKKYIIGNYKNNDILFNNIFLINLGNYYNEEFNQNDNILNFVDNNNDDISTAIENIKEKEKNISDEYFINYINNYNLMNKLSKEKNNTIIEIINDKETNPDEKINLDQDSHTNEENLDLDDLSSCSNDPWESSINDDKFYINNKVARIFPILKNFNNFSKIKIDDESFCFITIREIADMTSKIICYHLLQYNLNPQKIKIADYTSGVGGNVLSFSKYFKYVYAIEICPARAQFLENNISIYGFKNIDVINQCAIEFNSNELVKQNPSVIFMDPPWGGSNYKSNENLLLKLGSMGIEELIIDITQKFSDNYSKIIKTNPKEKTNNYNNKFIILKLPKNYDIEYLYNYLNNNNKTSNYNILSYLYILNKMLIVVCELQFIY